MNFTLDGSNIIIDNRFLISDDTTQQSDMLILSKVIGPDMHYQSQGMKIIDYPGEYELNGYTIEAISDSDGLLNYVIATDEHHIGYVQNSKLVTNRIFADVTDRICDRDDVITAIEKLDETGKVYDVRQG